MEENQKVILVKKRKENYQIFYKVVCKLLENKREECLLKKYMIASRNF